VGTSLEIETEIKSYMLENFLLTSDEIGPDTSFLEAEILDSTGILHLVMFIEARFGITVDGSEITPAYFDSITQLAAYVRRKSEGS